MTVDLSDCTARQLPPERGTLYLTTPLARTAEALQQSLRTAGLPVVQVRDGVFAVPFSVRLISIWRSIFSGALAPLEMELTRCRLMPSGTKATSAELMQAESLPAFLLRLEGQWLAEMLRHRRLMSLFQPIVRTDRPSEVYAYECLLRGVGPCGQQIAADRMFAAARGAGLLAALDQAALVTAIETAAAHHLQTAVFVNINLNAAHHPGRCLATTIATTQASGISPEQFVFEVVESDEITDQPAVLYMLDALRAEGFRVALDDVGAGYASLNLLARVKPDFMKLDMGLMRNVDGDVYKGQVAGKLLELARELRVKTVVEGVETVGEWQWSREHGADYAQGYLFARPAAEPQTSQFNPADQLAGRV